MHVLGHISSFSSEKKPSNDDTNLWLSIIFMNNILNYICFILIIILFTGIRSFGNSIFKIILPPSSEAGMPGEKNWMCWVRLFRGVEIVKSSACPGTSKKPKCTCPQKILLVRISSYLIVLKQFIL